jgi:hypothetical protein
MMKARLFSTTVITAVNTFATVAERIHELEQAFFPVIIEQFKPKYIITVMEHDIYIYRMVLKETRKWWLWSCYGVGRKAV